MHLDESVAIRIEAAKPRLGKNVAYEAQLALPRSNALRIISCNDCGIETNLCRSLPAGRF